MDYKEYAKELIDYIIICEHNNRTLRNSIYELARGEMAVLTYLMEEKDGACAQDISQRFHINTSRVAAVLNSLCKKKFIDRCSDEHDKRKIHVYITPLGLAYVHERRAYVMKHIMNMIEELGEDDTKELNRIMKRIALLSSLSEKDEQSH